MNRIVVELHPEDRERLDMISYRLALIIERLPGTLALASVASPVEDHPADASVTHLEPIDAPAPAAPAEPAAVEPVTDPIADPAVPVARPMALPEFQKTITMWLAANPTKKPQARDLVNRYAPSATEIPDEKRAEFLAELAKL